MSYGKGIQRQVLYEITADCGHIHIFPSEPTPDDIFYCVRCERGAIVIDFHRMSPERPIEHSTETDDT